MRPCEYEVLAAVEAEHWWFCELRRLMQQLIVRHCDLHGQGRTTAVLDAGCGTGANLAMLQDLLHPRYLGGFDLSPRAVELASSRVPPADVYVSDLCCPEIRTPELDLILCSDVLYATGLAPALSGLKLLTERLRSGGWLLLHLPAFNWLYTSHDTSVRTRERFRRSDVVRLLSTLNLQVHLATYRMCLLFPAVVLRRLPSILSHSLRGPGNSACALPSKSELTMPPGWLNGILSCLVRLESGGICRGLRFPIGSSLIALGRKP